MALQQHQMYKQQQNRFAGGGLNNNDNEIQSDPVLSSTAARAPPVVDWNAIIYRISQDDEIKKLKSELAASFKNWQHQRTQICLDSPSKLAVLKSYEDVMQLYGKLRLKAMLHADVSYQPPIEIGQCPDLCPELERFERETNGQIHRYERSMHMMLKEYSRASAAQEQPLSDSLRSPAICRQALHVLFRDCALDMPRGELSDWYNFMWDRTRAIRKDLTQQHARSIEAANVLEAIVRFHVFAAARMSQSSLNEFDSRMNREEMNKSLQQLKEIYEFLASLPTPQYSPHEAEMRSYEILLSLVSKAGIVDLSRAHADVSRSRPVRTALQIQSLYYKGDFIGFARMLQSLHVDFLTTCLMFSFLNQLRLQYWQMFSRSLNKSERPSVDYDDLWPMLMLNSFDEALRWAAAHRIIVAVDTFDADRRAAVVNMANDITVPAVPFPETFPLLLLQSKLQQQQNNIPEILNGGAPLSISSNEIVQNSPSAFDAATGRFVGRRQPPEGDILALLQGNDIGYMQRQLRDARQFSTSSAQPYKIVDQQHQETGLDSTWFVNNRQQQQPHQTLSQPSLFQQQQQPFAAAPKGFEVSIPAATPSPAAAAASPWSNISPSGFPQSTQSSLQSGLVTWPTAPAQYAPTAPADETAAASNWPGGKPGQVTNRSTLLIQQQQPQLESLLLAPSTPIPVSPNNITAVVWPNSVAAAATPKSDDGVFKVPFAVDAAENDDDDSIVMLSPKHLKRHRPSSRSSSIYDIAAAAAGGADMSPTFLDETAAGIPDFKRQRTMSSTSSSRQDSVVPNTPRSSRRRSIDDSADAVVASSSPITMGITINDSSAAAAFEHYAETISDNFYRDLLLRRYFYLWRNFSTKTRIELPTRRSSHPLHQWRNSAVETNNKKSHQNLIATVPPSKRQQQYRAYTIMDDDDDENDWEIASRLSHRSGLLQQQHGPRNFYGVQQQQQQQPYQTFNNANSSNNNNNNNNFVMGRDFYNAFNSLNL